MTRIIIGIDPGITGAAAALDHNGRIIAAAALPTIQIGAGTARTKRQIDASGFAHLIREWTAGEADDALVVMEKVGSMPGQGVASMFSLGDSVGCLRGVVATLCHRLEWVAPGKWKKHFRLNSEKESSRALAIHLYPGARLVYKRDHNLAEAILIARWGKETLI